MMAQHSTAQRSKAQHRPTTQQCLAKVLKKMHPILVSLAACSHSAVSSRAVVQTFQQAVQNSAREVAILVSKSICLVSARSGSMPCARLRPFHAV